MPAREAPETVLQDESIVLVADCNGDEPKSRISGVWVGITSCDEVWASSVSTLWSVLPFGWNVLTWTRTTDGNFGKLGDHTSKGEGENDWGEKNNILAHT